MIMTRTDPAQLEAFALLRKEGMDKDKIMRALRISERTYFYRLSEIRRVREQALGLVKAGG
jgi:hypothetical protein